MTREQKLGLIAGFTVVLLFGVLLADHLSRARVDPLVTADVVDGPLVIPSMEIPARAGSDSLPSAPRYSSGALSEPTGSLGAGPTRVAMGPPDVALSEPMMEGPVDSLSSGRGSGRASVDITSIFEPVGSGASSSGALTPGSSLSGFVPVETPRATTAERARRHVVKQGETLFSISERYYGTGHVWRELVRHNTGVVGSSGRVAVGAVLTVPTRSRLAGAVGASAAQPDVARATPRAAAASVESGSGEYVVKAGDTLSEISVELLGTTKRMDELIAMNRDKISDADDIRVGMKLRYRRGPSA